MSLSKKNLEEKMYWKKILKGEKEGVLKGEMVKRQMRKGQLFVRQFEVGFTNNTGVSQYRILRYTWPIF